MSAVVTGYDARIDAQSPTARTAHGGHGVRTGARVTGNLHPVVLRVSAIAYTIMIGAFWVGFYAKNDLMLSMFIVTVVLIAFLGVPWAMGRLSRAFMIRQGKQFAAPGSLRDFREGYFEAGDGHVTGGEALTLVATVPVCLACFAIAIAVIVNTVS